MADSQIRLIDMTTATGSELVQGLQSSSCVFLTGLGAIPEQLASMLAATRRFFALDEAEKERVRWSGEVPWQGWQPLYSAPAGQAMPMERFEVILPDRDGYGSDEEWLATSGYWPVRPGSLGPRFGAYYLSLRGLVGRLTALIAQGLDRPIADLSPSSGQEASLCVNHYLAQIEAPPDGQIRNRAHADHGWLTVLWGDDSPGGLEAQIGPDGSWASIVYPPDSLLLQAGELLHLWSGRVIPANRHRVVNPPRAQGAAPRERYSVVYFHRPNPATWVPFSADGREGVVAGEYTRDQQRRIYSEIA